MPLALGAYVLPGDPVWLRSSLERYYPFVDRLVVPVPDNGLGWNGRPIRVQECLSVVREVDVRGIISVVTGQWTDSRDPLSQDTAQRRAAVAALADMDWILQIDNDELLPSMPILRSYIEQAHGAGLAAVEWPMRVLFRRSSGSYLEVCSSDMSPHYEYPGPIAIRSDVTLVEARRIDGSFLRLGVHGDDSSLQLTRPPEEREERLMTLRLEDAIIHNSWARSPASVWSKVQSWGHATGFSKVGYYAAVWLPAPATWPLLRNFHPLSRPLWPRLRRSDGPGDLLSEDERFHL
ncbi:hypothetical protein ASH01_15910 [Terrabacter sp. Soil811]|uniref:hypothetical protein n=1 Tax=Terrabacter sp. Soil811 TaxID=1736419 RepID=UPI0006FE2597|nr:hypothetical protein [Terrabacter sp. Soil811]KRF43282.1 hypothetical protein ASH01_15910 [Terrabacter sp. Soil811]